jgi:hypothetical protein
VKLVLDAYKKWFLKEAKMPSFMCEPVAGLFEGRDVTVADEDKHAHDLLRMNERTSSVSSATSALSYNSANLSLQTPVNEMTRVGYTKCLQVFFFHSSFLLLNRYNLQKDKIKNVSCYLLEIYKLFIRKIKMDHYTW